MPGIVAWFAQPARADYHYYTSVPGGVDGVVQELRWPYWNNAYYNTWLSDNWTSSEGTGGYFYSGLALPSAGAAAGTSCLINWSFWPLSDPLNNTDTILPAYTSPSTFSAPTVAEGTILRAPGNWAVFQTNQWYRFAFRVWQPADGAPHAAYAGQWLRDPVTGNWHHMATVRLPFAATGIDGLMGFQEDATGGLQPQRTDYRNCYYHKNGQWQMANQFQAYSRGQKENAGLIENNTAVYYETCAVGNSNYVAALTNNGQSLNLTMNNQPATPAYDAIVVSGSSASVSGGQMVVQWQSPATSSPQLAYLIEVFNNPGYTGAPPVTVFARDPEARQKLVNISGIATPYARLSIIDIFDRTNTPITLTPAGVVLNDATNVAGAVNGVDFAYYESANNYYLNTSGTNWATMPDFASLTPVYRGVVNGLDLTPRRRRDGYAFNDTGYLNVPTDGLYAFTLNSDAGGKLYVDGQLVVNGDGQHSPADASGWIGLQAGLHAFNVQYFCDTQNNNFSSEFFDTLQLSYEGPGLAKAVVPASAYFRVPAGGPAISMASPADGAAVSGANVPLSASVAANGATINKVQYYVGDRYWGQSTVAPFNVNAFLWADGNNPVRARLFYDNTNVLDSAPVQATTTNMALAPWQFNQIFFHNLPNGASLQGGAYSLIGDGVNFLSRQVSGDCTLIAHLAALPGGAGPDGASPNSSWQAGIILRGGTDMTPGYPLGNGDVRFAAAFATVGGGSYYQDDTMINGGGAYSSSNLGSGNRWFKIQRVGDVFTTSVSANGTSWTAVNTNTLPDIGPTIYAGFFTYAQPSLNPNVPWAKFDSLTITGNLVGPPGVSVTPAVETAYLGQAITLTALPSGNAPFAYQWQYNGVNLANATNSTLTLTNLQATNSGLYSVVLSNANGTASAASTISVLTPSPATAQVLANQPVAYWRLNEAAGPTAYDSAGNFNGSGEGGVNFGAAGVAVAGFEADNLAAQFNGTDSDIALPALNLNTNRVTITGWVKRNGAQTAWAGLVFCRSGGTASGFHFGTANELRYTWNNAGGSYNWNSGLVVPDGVWTFVALVLQPSQASIYMATNGTLYGATNTLAHAVQAFGGTTYLGYDPNSSTRRLNGALDEVAVYNQALTPSQLIQILAASQTAAPSVILTAPVSGAGYAAPANVSLAAAITANGHTITKVQFYSAATLLFESAAAPYQFPWTNVPAGAYTVLAQAVYDGGSVQSSTPAFISVNPLPSAPSTVLATALASNLINVAWTPGAHANGYLVSRNGALIGSTGTTNYLDLGLSANTSYCYSIVATNLYGNSPASGTGCALTPGTGGALLWDADGETAGAQDGNGNWSGGLNWWNGNADVAWTGNNLALFGADGAADYTVAITSDITPAGLLFNANNGGGCNLSSSGGALNLSGTPTITANADATISAYLKGGGFLKAGPGTLTLNVANTNTGAVTVNGGRLVSTVSCWYSPRGIGSGALTVNNGGIAQFTQTHGFGADAGGRSATLNGGTLQFDHENYVSGLTMTAGTITGGGELRVPGAVACNINATTTPSVISLALNFVSGPLTFNVARGSGPVDLLVSGNGFGPGALTKSGAGLLRCTGAVTNTGVTTVSAGTLQVDGSLGTNTVAVQNTAMLAGVGLLNGTTTVLNGGTLAPGDAGIGKLAFAKNLTLAGRTVMELARVGSAWTNDVAAVTGTLTQGGSLVVTNISTNALTSGTSFKLFNAGTFTGSFTNVTLPSLPAQLAWNTTQLASAGRISVAANASFLPPVLTNFSSLGAGGFTLAGSGVAGQPYILMTASNLAPPVSWTPIATNAADAQGTFQFTDSQATNQPQRFYRVTIP